MAIETSPQEEQDFQAPSPEDVQQELEDDTRYPDDARTQARAQAENEAFDQNRRAIAREELKISANTAAKEADMSKPSAERGPDFMNNLRADNIATSQARIQQLRENEDVAMNKAGDAAEMQFRAAELEAPEKETA